MPYVTGAAILAHAHVTSPTSDEEDWADACAASIEALIDERLADVTVEAASNAEAELTAAALIDGAALYATRETAPTGRPADLADAAVALRPVLRRYGTPGIA
jgi:hypothetical protein